MTSLVRAGAALTLAGVLSACASATTPAGAPLDTRSTPPLVTSGQTISPSATMTVPGYTGAATQTTPPTPHRTCALTVATDNAHVKVTPDGSPDPIGVCAHPGTSFTLTFDPVGSLPNTTWTLPTPSRTAALTIGTITKAGIGWTATVHTRHAATTDIATASNNRVAQGAPVWVVTIRLIIRS